MFDIYGSNHWVSDQFVHEMFLFSHQYKPGSTSPDRCLAQIRNVPEGTCRNHSCSPEGGNSWKEVPRAEPGLFPSVKNEVQFPGRF